MTQKLFRFLPGVIAFILAGAPMLAANAQTPAQQPAQRPAQPAQQARPQITLTPAQQSEIEKIRQSALTQIRGVLTKEQQAQIDAADKPGAQRQVSLNLSQDQQKRINDIVAASRKQIVEKVLTQEQRNQLMQAQPQQSQPQR